MFCLAPSHLSPILFNYIAPPYSRPQVQTARFWDCLSHPRTSFSRPFAATCLPQLSRAGHSDDLGVRYAEEGCVVALADQRAGVG